MDNQGVGENAYRGTKDVHALFTAALQPWPCTQGEGIEKVVEKTSGVRRRSSRVSAREQWGLRGPRLLQVSQSVQTLRDGGRQGVVPNVQVPASMHQEGVNVTPEDGRLSNLGGGGGHSQTTAQGPRSYMGLCIVKRATHHILVSLLMPSGMAPDKAFSNSSSLLLSRGEEPWSHSTAQQTSALPLPGAHVPRTLPSLHFGTRLMD